MATVTTGVASPEALEEAWHETPGLGSDGSDRSNAAVTHAVELAKALGAKVTAITVSDPFPLIAAEPAVMTDVPEQFSRQFS